MESPKSYNYLTGDIWDKAEKSTWVSLNLPDISPLQETSDQNTLDTEKSKDHGTYMHRAEKKRMSDKAYRSRMKESRRNLEDHLRRLCYENEHLKSENDCLRTERDEMHKAVQSANAETKRLKSEISMLKRNIDVQQTLVETFSHRLITDDHRRELTQLKNKINVLSQSTKLEDWMIEKEELLGRVVRLENQNKVLRVQVEALCDRIINGKESEET